MSRIQNLSIAIGITLILSSSFIKANNFLLVGGEIISGLGADNAIVRYKDDGSFDRFFLLEGTVGGPIRLNDMKVGPDNALYVSFQRNENLPAVFPRQGRINRYSLQDGSFIDTFAGHPENEQPLNFTFGPDGNLYVVFEESRTIRRFGGPNSGNGGQIDPDFLLHAFKPVTISFGPDITGDQIGELYILESGGPVQIVIYDGEKVLNNSGQISILSRIENPFPSDNWADFIFGNDGVIYILSHRTVERYSFDSQSNKFVFLDNFISNLSSLSSLAFGPDVTDDGIQDLYIGTGGIHIDTVLKFDGNDGSAIGTHVKANVGDVSSVGSLLFVDLPDARNSDVFSLNYGVSFLGDTYVRRDLNIRRNDNYGEQEFFAIGTGREPVGSADAMRSLIFGFGMGEVFDIHLLSSEPASAILELTVRNFPNGINQTYEILVHPLTDKSDALFFSELEGNGFEGEPPIGSGSVDPDAASGVSWAGAGDNDDPNAENNFTQPNFDPTVFASAIIDQNEVGPGDVIRWDISPLVKDWFAGEIPNFGIVLRDPTTGSTFRAINFHSSESPNIAARPRLLIGYGEGNLDGDSDVDRDDLSVILDSRRSNAYGPNDSRDLDNDGKITILDARKLVHLCSRPRCATE